MRNMSFCKTTEQMYARTKTVTRRFGWWFLKPGDRVCAVEKGMGLKKGEKVQRICVIKIVSTRLVAISEMTPAECALEGFPTMPPREFMAMLWDMRPSDQATTLVNRIEFTYVED